MDDIKVTLKKPVEHNGTTYTDLTFREPNVGELVVADGFDTQMGKMVAILSAVSEMPLPAFKKIAGSDFKVIVAKTQDILGNGEIKTTGA